MKILVIRRDNIGDLVCTTPLLRALRRQLPSARIEVLVNSYNGLVLENNPDINMIHCYTKAKHRKESDSLIRIYIARFFLVLRLCLKRFDIALLPEDNSKSALRMARWIRAKRVISQSHEGNFVHEVERCCALLSQIGLVYETPHLVVCPSSCNSHILEKSTTLVIGVHISARKPSQQWHENYFIGLMRLISRDSPNVKFVLLWSPGRSDNSTHPGDDEKMETLMSGAAGIPIEPIATKNLDQLISAIAVCDQFICSDGGAMHIAAGLGKPVLALFGGSDPSRWHPWRVPYRIIQPETMDVASIDEAWAYREYLELVKKI